MFKLFKKKSVEKVQPEDQLKTLITAIHQQQEYIYSANNLSGIQIYEDLKLKPEAEQKELIFQLTDLITDLSLQLAKSKNGHSYDAKEFGYYGKAVALALQSGLLRKKLNYDETEWMKLFKGFKDCIDRLAPYKNHYFTLHFFPLHYAIKQLEYYLKANTPSTELLSFIKMALQWKEFAQAKSVSHYYGPDLAKAAKKLASFVNKETEVPEFRLQTDDIALKVNEIINSITEARTAYSEIFYLAGEASGSQPTNKFGKAVHQLQDQIGPDAYKKIAHQIIEVAAGHTSSEVTTHHEYNGRAYSHTYTTFLCNESQQFIKGMVWTLARYSDKDTIHLLGRLCEKTYTKIPGTGPAAASIGNACVYVLGNMRGKDGLGTLSHLKLKLRQNNIKKTIDNYLAQGAEKYNVSVEELKEMAVPAFNLDRGRKVIAFEDYRLEIFIENKKVNQQWLKPDGRPMKSVPGIVKKSAALDKKLQAARKEVKEIQKVFSAQKQRIDNQFILGRSWDLPSFQKYYLQHGLVYPITEKLIWTFTKAQQSADAILLDGQWHTLAGRKLDWIDEETTVQLWHPVNASEEVIIGWREKMMELEWQQPLKQAFREIYLLTEAEINTRTYSNRMAAHILKQHQFSSLANLRGWKYSLMGAYDDGRDNEVCRKYLPEYKITAEYWIDEMAQDDQFNDTGIWLYIATDQVKFKDEHNQTMQLAEVPKMVFTEIMRDVDMFVGVCSVGNDPQWADNNGERQVNRDYWNSYSFGDLSEMAKTRKAILERLLPRLKKLRDKAHIDGRFLVVKGSLRTYKIHIGSGNILMEPNDQYLCIVPARSAESATERVFIPFEGDKGLSIVLSKAFLLAEDDRITDRTITSQIKRASRA
jgi:hypothetical protein